ncbi:ATP-dependent nuclease [Curtobacterium sp. MCBA15_009]|uniref:ATP-dependent nuclease n=1 Tax=Curtobacterium sp. MCBA15_009 TaxID=1898737 RepID=UPI0009F34F2C|nr:ATP-dependent endonuclease [Curtobacterium sp. MCBA15_009]
MHLTNMAVNNFRRLKAVEIDLEEQTTIFVGANNSGKTSAAAVLRLLVTGRAKDVAIYDFSAECLETLRNYDHKHGERPELPKITLDLWFNVEDEEVYRVVDILPSLDWNGQPVGIRLRFEPSDSNRLFDDYRAAKENAATDAIDSYHPWPTSLEDYLKDRLQAEYNLNYYVLEKAGPDELREHPMLHAKGEAAAVLDGLMTLNFLDAQRFLSDTEVGARTQDLSRSLSKFYQRNLDQFKTDTSVLQALHASEESFNKHLEQVFASTLENLNTLGYPGIENPDLVIRSHFNPKQIMAQDASVEYSLPRAEGDLVGTHLPEKYNGLGFKNLIYMVIQVLDFHQRWTTQEHRTPVHLVVIEEPEAHLHAQLQQVFIAKIREIISDASGMTTQLIVTTHSAQIINESQFTPIRYFRRKQLLQGRHESEVRDVSRLEALDADAKTFLHKYMKLTHCDLFFADAAILVEGNVERLLLPSIIEEHSPKLTSSYLTILEVGGAFAHKLAPLLKLLGVPALVITDLDSVAPATKAANAAKGAPHLTAASNGRKACRADAEYAVTANPSLRSWHPRIEAIADLLALPEHKKVFGTGGESPAPVRIAYQTSSCVSWDGNCQIVSGRTFEETFAFENLEWVLSEDQRDDLALVSKKFEPASSTIDDIVEDIHKQVKRANFKKTELALALMISAGQWKAPQYIVDGLDWLSTLLAPVKTGGTTK